MGSPLLASAALPSRRLLTYLLAAQDPPRPKSRSILSDSVSVNSEEINFIITDFKNEINVRYSGAVPNLFEEGKGVVAEGFLKDRNYFMATKILAKHDENYMPPEVKKAIGEE